MTLIIISAAFSIVVLVMCYAASREGAGHVMAVAISGGFFCLLFAAGVGFIAVFLQCVLTLVLASLCWFIRPTPKVLFGCCLLAAVAANAFSARVGMIRIQTLRELREEYPVISLTDRLAYETNRTKHPQTSIVDMPAASGPAEKIGSSPSISFTVEKRLERFDQTGRRYRDYKLHQLHDRTHEQFVFAQGFGITRMSGVYRESIEQKDVPPIPLPQEPEYEPSFDPKDDDGVHVDLAETKPAPPQSLLVEVHDAGLSDFLNPDRFGNVESRDRVAGFRAHQFSRMPLNGAATDSWGQEAITWEHWRIQKLELVSLLKHDTPRVYISDHLPRMEQLEGARTRPLNAFETGALPKLATEQDLVIDDSEAGRILLLGALRAGNECRKCHSVDRGQLLGAFSYLLVRTSPKIRQRPKDNDGPSL
ncbi:MAG: hypothetical protein AB7O26_04540 [Planctomycetaceae bacterium]